MADETKPIEQDEAGLLIEGALTFRFLRRPIPTSKREEMWRQPKQDKDD